MPNIKYNKGPWNWHYLQGKPKKDHLKHRLSLGLARCKKMQTSYIPKKRCTKLVLSSCFPKAAYGIELSTMNDGTFQRFRTNVKKSLGYQKQGSSPWITLSLLGKNIDLEHYTITRTIFFGRKYVQIFPHRAQDICRKISANSNGPLQGIVCMF